MNLETSEQDQLISLMQKLVIYTKLANYDNIRNRLMEILNTSDKRCVFEATDGKNTTRDIESSTGVNISTISTWWREWQKEGIVGESQEREGRRYKVLSLPDFGIEVPIGRIHRIKK